MDDIDMISFMLGASAGKQNVELDSADGYTFTDANSDGNIVITEVTE